VWIANFVLMNYGTGAVMSVPAHDERDFAFAKQYHLPMQIVIQASDGHDFEVAAYTGDGQLINSGDFNDLDSQTAKQKIVEALEKMHVGKKTIQYRLRDWGVSRQRYWGTPIPIIYCEH
jgi:leucyl-tRNA synthetase